MRDYALLIAPTWIWIYWTYGLPKSDGRAIKTVLRGGAT